MAACVVPGFVFQGTNLLVAKDYDNTTTRKRSYHAKFVQEHLDIAKKIASFMETLSWVECHFDTSDCRLAKENLWLRLRTYASGEQKWSMKHVINNKDQCGNTCLVIEDVLQPDIAKFVIVDLQCSLSDLKRVAYYYVSRTSYTIGGGDLIFDAVRLPNTNQGFAISTFTINEVFGSETAEALVAKQTSQYCSKLFGALNILKQTDFERFFPKNFCSPQLQNTANFEWCENIEGKLLKTIQSCLDVNLGVLSRLKQKMLEGAVSCCDDEGFSDQCPDAFPDLVEDLYESIDVVDLEKEMFGEKT
eukprot:c13306_g1_i1.p1 GENE.c13306_g1_i1~~c13306_g1_i1.p1  ORF type:complete len:314 (-),score=52.81 c13306_g1_i1:153-1064(-)